MRIAILGALAACNVPIHNFVGVDDGGLGMGELYVKAPNTGATDYFGRAVAVSRDGTVMVIGAPGEQSASPTSLDNNAADNAGAAYVYARGNGSWQEPQYLKAGMPRVGDEFARQVALSADGSTLAIASSYEANATSIEGTYTAPNAGAVFVFRKNGTVWMREAYLKATTITMGMYFGSAVALSADGNTLAVGADSESTTALNSGAVFVFNRTGATWQMPQELKAMSAFLDQHLGMSVALSADGNMLVAGAPFEATGKGAVYVYTRPSVAQGYSQSGRLLAPNGDAADEFGLSVSLASDGSTVAVGAPFEGSNAVGINGDQADNSLMNAGAVYVFERSGMTFSPQATYIKSSNTDGGPTVVTGDRFGFGVALSHDGNVLVVAAKGESSNATGLGGNQVDNSLENAGAAYVFRRTGTWSQRAYVKASNPDSKDEFGECLALSDDAGTLVVGAWRESSAATGVGGDAAAQADNSAMFAGAAYVITGF